MYELKRGSLTFKCKKEPILFKSCPSLWLIYLVFPPGGILHSDIPVPSATRVAGTWRDPTWRHGWHLVLPDTAVAQTRISQGTYIYTCNAGVYTIEGRASCFISLCSCSVLSF